MLTYHNSLHASRSSSWGWRNNSESSSIKLSSAVPIYLFNVYKKDYIIHDIIIRCDSNTNSITLNFVRIIKPNRAESRTSSRLCFEEELQDLATFRPNIQRPHQSRLEITNIRKKANNSLYYVQVRWQYSTVFFLYMKRCTVKSTLTWVRVIKAIRGKTFFSTLLWRRLTGLRNFPSWMNKVLMSRLEI